jgi:hypothetical protein
VNEVIECNPTNESLNPETENALRGRISGF